MAAGKRRLRSEEAVAGALYSLKISL